MALISRNGKSFDNGSVQILMLGSMDYEVTKLTYGVKQAHTAYYSLGSNSPSSYGQGKREYNCTLGLRLASQSALEKAVGGDLLSLKPFTIVVTYVDDENEIIVDKILCKFTNNGREVGDSEDFKFEFEMFALNVEFNTTSK